MKIKISILILFLILSINNVYAVNNEDGTGQFISLGGSTESYGVTSVSTWYANPIVKLKFNDISVAKGVQTVICEIPESYWKGDDAISAWGQVDYRINSITGDIVATGTFGYNRGYPYYYAIAFFDENTDLTKNGLYSGTQIIYITGNVMHVEVEKPGSSGNMYYLNYGSVDTSNLNLAYMTDINDKIIASTTGLEHKTTTSYTFENTYTYYKTYNSLNVILNKSSIFPSQVMIENNIGYQIINETSINDENITVSDWDIINNTWYLNLENSYGDFFQDIIFFDVDDTPTLNTNKIVYNTSEIIEISYTNIDKIYNDCISSICAKPYNLHILYPVTDAYKQYETKYIYPLTYSLEDEFIYLNTSFLSPENNYILGIVGINGDYTQHEDILIFSDSFTVYPDDEYLSISCDSESECYTYNNADITIYYKINNNSNIIVKDNDNNIINTYYNIINEGSILYHIPDDLNYENTYPNWKIYLNNTEYSTSFNKGIIVYWSQFQTPTPTPTFTPQPTADINISDEIDNLKDEISPIKDLIFGLSEIVIDNPDYNKDNIVDENEINHWFNSLIPLCIIFLLIILYIGLKKQRE